MGGAVTATSAAGTDDLAAAAAGTDDLTGALTLFARPATARDWRGVAPRTVLSEAALPEGVPAAGVPSEVLLCDEPASAPTSATATAVPPTIPAPSPSVTAAVPSQA